MAVIVVFLAAVSFAIAGGFVGYCCGYDKGWETATECLEKEVKNVQGNTVF